MHKRNCFVSLTLREDQESLDHSQWQRFAKRARRKLGPFRFYMAGEYGELEGRPHYHALLFGVDFEDRVYAERSPSGEKLYSSATLERLWGLGYTSVGEVTFQSAAYVARYVMKKVTGESSADHYGGRVPEYCRMSNGGGVQDGARGIGFRWFDKYGGSDVLADGNVLIAGVRTAAPRYYRKLLKERYPLTYRGVQLAHREDLDRREKRDFTDNNRLQAREKVLDARVGMLKRKI